MRTREDRIDYEILVATSSLVPFTSHGVQRDVMHVMENVRGRSYDLNEPALARVPFNCWWPWLRNKTKHESVRA